MSESFNQEYQRKLISAKEAAGRVNSGNCIHIGGGANVATVIDANLALRKDELENVTVHTFTDTTPYQICSRDPKGEVF